MLVFADNICPFLQIENTTHRRGYYLADCSAIVFGLVGGWSWRTEVDDEGSEVYRQGQTVVGDQGVGRTKIKTIFLKYKNCDECIILLHNVAKQCTKNASFWGICIILQMPECFVLHISTYKEKSCDKILFFLLWHVFCESLHCESGHYGFFRLRSPIFWGFRQYKRFFNEDAGWWTVFVRVHR